MFDNKKIVFIHGLASKPPKEILHKYWLHSLYENLSLTYPDNYKNIDDLAAITESSYWANATPSHIEDSKEYYEKMEECIEDLIKNRRYKKSKFHAGKDDNWLSFFKKGGINAASFIARALTVKDDVARKFLIEVELYTNDQYTADKMRLPLEETLRKAWDVNKEVCLISHSMGTFISYDVLWRFSHRSEPEYAKYRDKAVKLFITMGSPLGDDIIQNLIFAKRYKDDGAREFPTNIDVWQNYSCFGDVVSHDSTLKDDFMERMQAINLLSDYKDYIKLYNPYLSPKGKENPHKSYGYLVQPKIAKHIDNFLNT